MIKKFFNDIVEFIKEEYKFIIFLLLSVILFLFPVNYYIIVGGDISNIDDRVIISDSYNSKGSFNISYVSELKGRLGLYLVILFLDGKVRVLMIINMLMRRLFKILSLEIDLI